MILMTLFLMAAPPTAPLQGEVAYPPLTGGSGITRLVVSPDGRRVAAVAADRAFVRMGPGKWDPIRSVEGWVDGEPVVGRQLPTGEVIAPLIRVDGRLIGVVEAGVVESKDMRGLVKPTPLPVIRPVAVAVDPEGAKVVLVAGHPAGLYLCHEDRCVREQPGSFTSVAWFADDTRLAGDAEGGVWLFVPNEQPRRLPLSKRPIVDLSGVPDGGPRYARDSLGVTWLSEDHGRSWNTAPWPGYRLGSGGMKAWRGEDGRIGVEDLQGKQVGALGDVPEAAPLRWAGPDHVIVGLADGLLVYERTNQVQRRHVYPGGARLPFLAAIASTDGLYVYASRDGNLVRFEGPVEAEYTPERFASDALSGAPFILTTILVLVLMGIWLNRRFDALNPMRRKE